MSCAAPILVCVACVTACILCPIQHVCAARCWYGIAVWRQHSNPVVGMSASMSMYSIAAGSLVAGAVWSVALTPDGRRVVTGSEDFTARVWDVVSGNCAHVLDGHTGWVVHVCTTADGLRCATASHDGTARSAC